MTTVGREKAKIQALFQWLKGGGAVFPAASIEVWTEGRELRATRPIASGTETMHIPRDLMITTEAAKESPIGRLITSYNCDISDAGYMAAHLVHMKRYGSFWNPYLDVLPASIPEHPYFLSEPDLAYLDGSYVQRIIQRRRRQLEYEYQQLRACLPEELMLSRKEYVWGCAIYQTRTHTVRIAGTLTHALVPLADMPNHASDPNLLWSYESSDGFHYTAARDVPPGEPLTISYWKQCNGLTLARFGFCVEDNPYDVAEIQLPSMPSGHPYFDRAASLGMERNGMRVFRVPRDEDASASKALLSYLRLSLLSAPVDDDTRRRWADFEDIGPLDAAKERSAMMTLRDACRKAIENFPADSNEDISHLRDPALPTRLKNLVRVRLGEKAILDTILKRTEQALSRLGA